MPIFQKSQTTAYLKKQGAKGTAAEPVGANAIDPLNDSGFVQPKGELIDRGLIRGSRWPSAQTVGGRWGEGSYSLELRGSGTAGTEPEFGPFLETLMGTASTNAAGTVTAETGAVGGFGSTLELVVGQLARVAVGTGYEVRRIATVSGSGPYTYTVARNFSEAPADGAVIAAGVTYHHLGTEAEQYFTLIQFLAGLELNCVDGVCESLNVGVGERQVIKGEFGLRALTITESADTDELTAAYDDTAPLIGTDCNLVIGATATNMKQVDFSLTTRRARGGINTAGYGELPWLSKFDATAKLTPWVESEAPITAFFAGTLIDVEMTKGTTAGNILHIELTDLQRTGPSIGDDEGDYSWDDPLTITGGITIGFF